MINGLKATHTSDNMIRYAKAAKGVYRSEAIDSVHPVVRVHPVTGEKSIFLNKEFLKSIIGLKEQEEELLVKFLMDHVISGHDFQARVPWEKHTVVMFDGRTTLRKSFAFWAESCQALLTYK
jgi:sulfonate dioxygenase